MKQVPCAVWEMQERQVSKQQPSCSGFSSSSYLPGFLASFTSFRSRGDPSRGASPLLPPCLGSSKSLDPNRGTPLHVGLGRRSRDWCFHGQWWQDVCVCVCASVGVCAWFALFRELRVGDGGGRWREGCQVQCDPVVRRTRR